MDDKTAIGNSYASILDQLFKVLVEDFIEASGNAPSEAQSVQSFKDGLANARKARDAAIAAL